MQKNDKLRLYYLDRLKGFLILWVVWYHTIHPDWAAAYFHVPLFFILSGFFVKPGRSFGEYAKRKTNQLLVPFFFFYLFGFIYTSGYHLLRGDLLETLTIKVLYNWALPETLPFNAPIWFLFTLYIISLICYPIMKWIKSPWIGIGIPMVISYLLISIYPKTMFPMQGSYVIQWLPFVLFGYYFGKKILRVMENRKSACLIGTACTVGISITLLYSTENPYLSTPVYYSRIFLFGGIILYLFRYLLPDRQLKILSYYGKNSMILLGIQSFILNIMLLARPHLPFEANEWLGLCEVIVCSIVAIPAINLMNRYTPQWIGKAPLLR